VSVRPAAPVADLVLPWDDDAAPPPIDGLAAARAELGDTFVVLSGGEEYLFVFSAGGVRSFYELAERDASKGLADYRMLLRKLPRELFDGRRTFAHDLFGAHDTESYLEALDFALAIELAALGEQGTIDAFPFARRVGHRLGLACWIGPDVAASAAFDDLVVDLDTLDGADAFVKPEVTAAVRASGHAEERAALARVEAFVVDLLANRRPSDDFLDRIVERWSDVDDPVERGVGVARDVVLLHVATMTNLVAALGWAIAFVALDPDSAAAGRAGDRPAVDRAGLEAVRLGQRSIMMRTVLRPVRVDVGDTSFEVDPPTIVATMLPLTNLGAAPGLDRWRPDRWLDDPRSGEPALATPELVTTYGHGSHRCPARRFSMSAIARTVIGLWSRFDLVPRSEAPPEPLPFQIGGVGRPAERFLIDYRRVSPSRPAAPGGPGSN
jgi:cytochrome P450